MHSKTKAHRAQIALEILNENKGKCLTLGEWLDLLNKKLKSHYSLRSTKECAFMFRYISTIMHLKLVKVKKTVTMEENVKGINTFYIYEGGEQNAGSV